jgi:Zn ribbon nucleic-acid-binding protein
MIVNSNEIIKCKKCGWQGVEKDFALDPKKLVQHGRCPECTTPLVLRDWEDSQLIDENATLVS